MRTPQIAPLAGMSPLGVTSKPLTYREKEARFMKAIHGLQINIFDLTKVHAFGFELIDGNVADDVLKSELHAYVASLSR